MLFHIMSTIVNCSPSKWTWQGTVLTDPLFVSQVNIDDNNNNNNSKLKLNGNCKDNYHSFEKIELNQLDYSSTEKIVVDSDEKDDENIFSMQLLHGVLFSALSALFFSLTSVLAKYLVHIHPFEFALFTFSTLFILTIPFLLINGLNPFGPSELRHILILRGLFGCTAMFLRFYAFRYLPIADASIIVFSMPVFVTIFAFIFLQEDCGIFQTITLILTMLGLSLTSKLPELFTRDDHIDSNYNRTLFLSNITSFLNNTNDDDDTNDKNHLYGLIAAFSSILFTSGIYIFTRQVKSLHFSIIMFNVGWVSILETSIVTTLLDVYSIPQTIIEWILLFLSGLCLFCGQSLLTYSLQLEQAGPVSVVRAATDIALAFVWQLWLFNDIPDIWSISGASLVTSCIVLTGLHKWVSTLPKKK